MSPSCLNLLHYFSAHRYIAATVQSKASCIQSQPQAESGLGSLVLKCGCSSRLSRTLLNTAAGKAVVIRGDPWNGALPRCRPCSCHAFGTKKSHCPLRVRRNWCLLHPARGAQTSVPPPYLYANANAQVKHPYVSSTDSHFKVECMVHNQKNEQVNVIFRVSFDTESLCNILSWCAGCDVVIIILPRLASLDQMAVIFL